ncbi:hypothetical protein [Fibrella aquatilis]|uniref:Uncharacterized protein n=1 Tax=Fibrella aquatilis TaxID=2817059 RepID=A0A939JWV2_9BACT|nr:hypothetical protein [Fibrella aquatilis]MBO0930384.1 hypothetical protein [Fibrella aquatilis]
MSTQTKPRSGATKTASPKRRIDSPASRALRKHIVYHDPNQWKKDIETGSGE